MQGQPFQTMTERTSRMRRRAKGLIDRLVGRSASSGVTDDELREIKETLATLVGAVRALSRGLDGYREREVESLNRDATGPADVPARPCDAGRAQLMALFESVA